MLVKYPAVWSTTFFMDIPCHFQVLFLNTPYTFKVFNIFSSEKLADQKLNLYLYLSNNHWSLESVFLLVTTSIDPR